MTSPTACPPSPWAPRPAQAGGRTAGRRHILLTVEKRRGQGRKRSRAFSSAARAGRHREIVDREIGNEVPVAAGQRRRESAQLLQGETVAPQSRGQFRGAHEAVPTVRAAWQ